MTTMPASRFQTLTRPAVAPSKSSVMNANAWFRSAKTAKQPIIYSTKTRVRWAV